MRTTRSHHAEASTSPFPRTSPRRHRAWKALPALALVLACVGPRASRREIGLPAPVAQTPSEKSAVALIQAHFGSDDYREWLAGRRELVSIGGPAAPFLVYAMATSDSVVQHNCLETLVDIGAPAVTSLTAALEATDPDLRRSAAVALGRIGTGAPRQTLRQLAESGAAWSARTAAIEALGRMGDRESVPLLLRCLADPKSHIRQSAAWALGQIGDPRSTSALETAMLNDDAPAVRAAAKEALRILEGIRPRDGS